MEKERRIKMISAITLIVAVLGLTVAFAVLSANLTINGTAKVDPGTWNIYFENLLQTSLKGKAQIENSASIDDNDKTRINNMNVILKQPKDEVIYTVELINGGNIDAEISSINGPGINGDIANYIEFSATYADKKPITEGDILKGNEKEDVTISIKFKEDVTTLPESDLIVSLSYEINYVQTDKKVEENVHNGEANTPKIDYEGLNLGSELKLGEEEFYVLENGEKELKLLAKYNLLVGNSARIENDELIVNQIDENTPGYGRQNPKAGFSLESDDPDVLGTLAFAKHDDGRKIPECILANDRCNYGYWVDDSGSLLSNYKNSSLGNDYPAYVYNNESYLYEPIQEYKSYLEELGYNVKEARLIKYEEAVELKCNPSEDETEVTSDAPSWFDNRIYWTGSAKSSSEIWAIVPDDCMVSSGFIDNYEISLRPVIVLNK